MKITPSSKIENFFKDIQFQSIEKYQILMAVRDLVLDVNKKLSEDIKYGGLVFNLGDELMGGIFVYKKHLSLEIGRGSELPDPKNILEGAGKSRRHIKLRSLEDIEKKEVSFFAKKAFGS